MARDDDFAEFAAARWPRLVRSAVLLGCRVSEAEDVAQATLLRCYLKWSKVQRATDRDAYVFRMLVNVHRDSHRRRWWGEQPTEQLPERPTGDTTADIDTADAIARALAALSRPHREVVVLRFYAHLSEQHIAEILQIAPGTVKSRLSRALAQLAGDANLADIPGGSHP